MFLQRLLALFIFTAILFMPGDARPAVGKELISTGSPTIPYYASLTDPKGRPAVDGPYDFRFTFYDSPLGGSLLWSETQSDVVIKDGRVAVALGSQSPVPLALRTAGGLWLASEVRGPSDSSFTALEPRQLVTRSSMSNAIQSEAAASSCAHTHLNETWTGQYANYAFGIHNQNIAGQNNAGTAILGITDSHIPPSSSAPGHSGVFGYASDFGNGVLGQSVNGYGVSGLSTQSFGVSGQSTSYFGVSGRSANYSGIWAEGKDTSRADDVADLVVGGFYGEIMAPGQEFYLSTNQDLMIQLDHNNNDSDGVFQILDGTNTAKFQVRENGDMLAIGAKSSVVKTESSGQRMLYAVESPEVWFEDFGTAQLSEGEGTVFLDPLFAQTINSAIEYHVFLTPLGECSGLYVSVKTAQFFTVKELNKGMSNTAFDYRIIGKRIGYENSRLEPASLKTKEEKP